MKRAAVIKNLKKIAWRWIMTFFDCKTNLVISTFMIILLFPVSSGHAGISGSNHDLSIAGASNFSGTFIGDDDEVCVYCHTPHGSVGAQTPLWNRTLNFPGGFTVYESYTMDSSPADPPSTISLLCLSCHDGVGAINAVLNSPGPGSPGLTPTGFDQIGDLGPLAQWVNIGDGDPSAPGSVDLSNDHPISMNWADRGSGFHATPQDARLELFNDKVECSTCHDPHNGNGGLPTADGEIEFLSMSKGWQCYVPGMPEL